MKLLFVILLHTAITLQACRTSDSITQAVKPASEPLSSDHATSVVINCKSTCLMARCSNAHMAEVLKSLCKVDNIKSYALTTNVCPSEVIPQEQCPAAQGI